MIQRIQTLYLLLATILSCLLLTGSIAEISGTSSVYELSFLGIATSGDINTDIVQRIVPLTIFLVLTPAFSVITIFLYKNRRLQMRFSLVISGLIILSVLMGVFYIVPYMNSVDSNIILNIKLLIPFISLVLTCMAYRAIRNDENLVRSYDRLR